MRTIYTLECSRCRHVTQVSGENDSNAKNNAGQCQSCAAKGLSWQTWHIIGKS